MKRNKCQTWDNVSPTDDQQGGTYNLSYNRNNNILIMLYNNTYVTLHNNVVLPLHAVNEFSYDKTWRDKTDADVVKNCVLWTIVIEYNVYYFNILQYY